RGASGTLLATYADDTAFLATGSTPSSATWRVQTFLNEFECWASRWNIALNVDKTQHATFALRPGRSRSLYLDGDRLKHEQRVTYLGVTLDRRLCWKGQIDRVCGSARMKLDKMDWLLRSDSGLSLQAKVRLFKAIVLPTLN
ncbi:hypothetical protein KR084_000998, partial [Drosophila pseudotakahashii]